MSNTPNDQNDELVDNSDLPQESELDVLKRRADQMGIEYHPSIGLEKLKAKVNAALEAEDAANAEEDEPVAVAPVVEAPKPLTINQKKKRLRDEAAKLVRFKLSCMNPAKAEWEGEVFTAGNSVVGTFKRFVPFNAEEGWHAEQIIFNQIRDRECQIFVTKTDDKGNKRRTGKMIKEFSIEILDPLTKEEIDELALRQAASRSVG